MNKDLTSIEFDTTYTDSKAIQEFYSKALTNAQSYKRISAYFSLGIFKFLSKGIPEFINNDGYMQLVLSTDIAPEIYKEISKGYKSKEEKSLLLLSKNEILKSIEEMCLSKSANLFSYLIAVGKLDIKIAYKDSGICHPKFGCISDGKNNLVYIGSNNFTEKAVDGNDEAFQVTIDWDGASKREKKTIADLNRQFDSYWNNNVENTITMDVPDPILDKMFENIDYNEISKYKKNPNFVRFDINDQGNVVLFSNIDLSSVCCYKNIGEYTHFLRHDNKFYYLENVQHVSEIYAFNELLKKYCDNNNLSYYLTLNASKFFSLHYRNYEDLAQIGSRIKSNDYIGSEDFNNYKKDINNCIKRELKDKQIEAAIHIIKMEKSLNFSVPGSGKTATVLGAFEYLNNLPVTDIRHVDKLLVVGPLNCSKSWRDEYGFVSNFASDGHVLNMIGDDSSNDKIEVLLHDYSSCRVILINYELIPKIENELVKLVDEKTFVVFDEIHRIKKNESQKYKSLTNIIRNTRYRVALTGTPMPNGYIDMFNMISLLHDEYTGSYFKMYEPYLKQDDNKYRKTGLQNFELNKRLYPFYERINKKDLNVPPAEKDNLIDVLTNKREREYYNDIIQAKYGAFENYIRLVEIGCVPFKINDSSIVEKSSDINFNVDTDNYLTSKLCKFLSIVKENNRKCVVWCNFIDTIRLVTILLNKNGIKAKAIYGATEQKDRDQIIDEFNYNNTLQVIVTNPATLAESVSLHKSCHDAHYLELGYNLYQYLQSRDRIHRLGLKETDKTNYYIYLNYYDDDMKLSKDKEIYEALAKKEKLMRNSIDRGGFFFGEGEIF